MVKEKFDLEVTLTPGDRGEFTVWVDGNQVIKKTGDDFPPLEEILPAVQSRLAIT